MLTASLSRSRPGLFTTLIFVALPIVFALTGRPGYRIPVDPTRIDELRENVYQQDWYDIYPPSEAELAAAYKSVSPPSFPSLANHHLEEPSRIPGRS